MTDMNNVQTGPPPIPVHVLENVKRNSVVTNATGESTKPNITNHAYGELHSNTTTQTMEVNVELSPPALMSDTNSLSKFDKQIDDHDTQEQFEIQFVENETNKIQNINIDTKTIYAQSTDNNNINNIDALANEVDSPLEWHTKV